MLLTPGPWAGTLCHTDTPFPMKSTTGKKYGHDSEMALIMQWRLLGRTETLKVGGCKQLSAFDSALELELSDATSLLLSRVK